MIFSTWRIQCCCIQVNISRVLCTIRVDHLVYLPQLKTPFPVKGLGISCLASIDRVDAGSSIMPLGASWGSDPGGRSLGPVSSEYFCQASLGIGMLKDSLRCHYFAGVKFFCVSISECSHTRSFQFSETLTLLMCSTMENVLLNITWYWGEI